MTSETQSSKPLNVDQSFLGTEDPLFQAILARDLDEGAIEVKDAIRNVLNDDTVKTISSDPDAYLLESDDPSRIS